jgi:protein deglycase
MKTAVIILAEGFEEVEALTPADYLRRAGISVTLAGVGGKEISGSHGIRVIADNRIEALGADFDCVVVPGGMPGSKNIAGSAAAVALIRGALAGGKIVAAICAAPAVVLGNAAGVLEGRRYTCFPGMERECAAGEFRPERVVVDGNLITSRAAGTAGEFSIAIVEAMVGTKEARELAERVLLAR